MAEVASRELRNQTRSLLDRVAGGETVTITVEGRPVAQLQPVSQRPRWIARNHLTNEILEQQADSGLSSELADIAGERTDDAPLR